MGGVFSRVLPWREPAPSKYFTDLPDMCKVKIFSYLNVGEKGVAAQVCREWQSLMKSPVLWSRLDLTEFMLHSVGGEQTSPKQNLRHSCESSCYATYQTKMNAFLAYVVSVSPSVRLLKFAFDIGDMGDGWLDYLRSFLAGIRCKELTTASFGWKETAVKPKEKKVSLEEQEEDAESVRRTRHRQRHFVGFFELFTSMAPNLCHLELEFDWSVRSVDALSSLRRLERLTVRRYFVFQSLDQSLLDKLLDSLPCLKSFEMEVWTPNSTGLCMYSMRSKTLQHLDVSASRGFYLTGLDLPNVLSICVGYHPWNGPLVTIDCTPLPCIYHILARGAPSLRKINGLVLQFDWGRDPYPDLSSVLGMVCPCHLHKMVSENSFVK